MKYKRKFNVTIEVWVTHRNFTESGTLNTDEDLKWKASVRHSNGSMEWKWCKTHKEAVEWCESFNNA